jgi:ubiquinone/menaquinone biosynthesis C-methylase UbiE
MAAGTRSRDMWSEWLLHRRHGGDPESLRRTLEWLAPIRDRVLANARVTEGDVVLDVGCGDGLIAFGALVRIGATGRVIFSDVSQDLLDHSRELARRMGELDRCTFVRAAAEDLGAIANGSVDVVTTRSVVIYVSAKDRAFHEFFRVLRPGGRLSMFEPINRFNEPRSPGVSYEGFDMTPVLDLYGRIRDFYRSLQPRDSDPMLDFDERDLVELADRAGFQEVRLEYRAEIAPPRMDRPSWDKSINASWNPKVPSLAEAMRTLLTEDEIERYASYVRPLFESRAGRSRNAYAYLWATK